MRRGRLGRVLVAATFLGAGLAPSAAESNNANNGTTARIRISKNGVTVIDPGTGP